MAKKRKSMKIKRVFLPMIISTLILLFPSLFLEAQERVKSLNIRQFEIEESIKKFISKIKLNIPDLIIKREDERFTSKLSKIYINQVTKKKKLKIDKKNLDKISASLILESFLKRNK